MRILVTGGAGFIGSAVAKELAQRGNEIIAVDNFSSFYSIQLKRLRVRELLGSLPITFLEVDLSNADLVRKLFDDFKFESVVHLAAQPGVRMPVENWNHYTRDNLVAFSNLISIVTSRGIGSFLYASSSSVYGNIESGRFYEQDQNVKPISFYGATKRANEIIASAVSNTNGVRTRGLRFFTVYGPWGRPDMVYFRMISSALTGVPFRFYGNGDVERDFTYIDDVASISSDLLFDLERRALSFHDVVNVGGGRPIAIKQLLDVAEKVSGSPVPYSQQSANPSDVWLTKADYTYLNSLIGKFPSIDIEIGMSRFFNWATKAEIKDNLDTWVKSVS